MNHFLNWAAVLGSFATAAGVFFAWWQVRRSAIQARTDFEDDLAREYRGLAREIPTNALLGLELNQDEQAEALKLFYHYVDLSNEQAFLRMNGRVSRETWLFWCDGIRTNLERPAFKKAWEEIKLRVPTSFEELRRLERSSFAEDPKKWS